MKRVFKLLVVLMFLIQGGWFVFTPRIEAKLFIDDQGSGGGSGVDVVTIQKVVANLQDLQKKQQQYFSIHGRYLESKDLDYINGKLKTSIEGGNGWEYKVHDDTAVLAEAVHNGDNFVVMEIESTGDVQCVAGECGFDNGSSEDDLNMRLNQTNSPGTCPTEFQAGEDISYSTSMADLNTDTLNYPGQEVVAISKDKKIYVWKSNGQPYFADNPNCPGYFRATDNEVSIDSTSPAIGDLDLDINHHQEIVVGAEDKKVYVLKTDGINWQDVDFLKVNGSGPWPFLLSATADSRIKSSPVIANIDTSDSQPEIVVATWDSQVYALKWNGSIKWQTKLPPECVGCAPTGIRSSPAIGDLDYNLDHKLSILVGTYDSKYATLYKLDQNGSVVGFKQAVSTNIYSSPVLADINGDGKLEIIFTSKDSDPLKTRLYVLNSDLSDAVGWSGGKVLAGQVSNYSSPTAGDLAGFSDVAYDRDLEIVVPTYNGKIFAFHHDGSLVTGWPDTGKTVSPGFVDSTASIGDVDGDGKMEVIVGSRNAATGSTTGKLQILQDNSDTTVTIDSGPIKAASPVLGDRDSNGLLDVNIGTENNSVFVNEFYPPISYESSLIKWSGFRSDLNNTGVYKRERTVPLMNNIGNFTAYKGDVVTFNVSATDKHDDGSNGSIIDIRRKDSLTTPPLSAFTYTGNGTGTFSWDTFNLGDTLPKTYTIYFMATDDTGLHSACLDSTSVDCKKVDITVNPPRANNNPVLDDIPAQNGTENSILSFLITASDQDLGDSLTISVSGVPCTTACLPAGGAMTKNLTTGKWETTYTWTPDYSQSGNYVAQFTVSDGHPNGTSTKSPTISIANSNRAPIANDDGSIVIVEENAGTAIDVLVNDTDLDGLSDIKKSTVTITQNPDPLKGSITNIDLVTGKVTYKPNPDFFGTDTFKYTVKDMSGTSSNAATVSITVTGTPDVPTITAIGPQSVDENKVLVVNIAAYDPDCSSGNCLTLSWSSVGNQANFGTLVDNHNGTGTLTFSPDYTKGRINPYSITVKATDDTNSTVSTTFNLTVNNINQPPDLSLVGNKTTNENQLLEFEIFATDPDSGTVLTFPTPTNLPAGAYFFDNGDGSATFSWIPAFGQAGSYPVHFSVSDGTLSDSEDITITVNHSNQPPVFDNFPYPSNVNEGALINFTVSASDPDGNNVTMSMTNAPANATLGPAIWKETTQRWEAQFSWQTGYHDGDIISKVYNITFTADDNQSSPPANNKDKDIDKIY